MRSPILSYRDLVVWQKAMHIIDDIDHIVEQFSTYQRFWLGSQMHRAALSIASNIAEGHGADYRNVYLRHLSIAKGSVTELETQLLVVVRRRYVPVALTSEPLALTGEIGRMLRALSAHLRDASSKSPIPTRDRRHKK